MFVSVQNRPDLVGIYQRALSLYSGNLENGLQAQIDLDSSHSLLGLILHGKFITPQVILKLSFRNQKKCSP